MLRRCLPFDTGPCVASLWLEDLAELGHGFRLGVEWSMLILATVPNPTPACEQNIQVNPLLINNLKETEHHISCGDSQTAKINMTVFFSFYLPDKRDNMHVIDPKDLYVKSIYMYRYINNSWPIICHGSCNKYQIMTKETNTWRR